MSSGLPPPDYTVNESGERIIAASKRPDGTVRKERRVRAGYVPQDEQQVYVSRGAAVSSASMSPAAAFSIPSSWLEGIGAQLCLCQCSSVRTCPSARVLRTRQVSTGCFVGCRSRWGKAPFHSLSHCAEPPKPKTKAAAKNAKRKEKRLAESGGGGSSAGESAAAAVQKLSLGGAGAGPAPAPAAAAVAAAVDEPPSVEKQIRTLKKKMRQAEALGEKKAAGQALSAEEDAKLARLAAWQEELAALEAQL